MQKAARAMAEHKVLIEEALAAEGAAMPQGRERPEADLRGD
jgi:hypothetical protein